MLTVSFTTWKSLRPFQIVAAPQNPWLKQVVTELRRSAVGQRGKILSLAALLLRSVLLPHGAPLGVAAENNSRVSTIQNARTWADNLRQPASWLTWGGELRFRHEYHANAATLDRQADEHEFNYQRYRCRLWTTLKPFAPLTLKTRFTGEPRYYFKPDSRQGLQIAEGIVDTFNVSLRSHGHSPLTLTLGRQDVMFGNLWLFFDGTTRDASRTDFFDAARLAWKWAPAKTDFDVICYDNSANASRGLPALNNQHRALSEENSRGVILYVTSKSLAQTQLDAFFARRRAEMVLPNGNDADLHVFGGRVETILSSHWKIRAEGAGELGRKNSQTLRAFGFNSLLTYAANDHLSNSFHAAYEYLSGDNPATGAQEGFDPMWGRRALVSELLTQAFAMEENGRSAEWTNFQRLGAGWNFCPARNVEWLADYHALFANENPHRGTPGFSNHGRFRGHLATGILKFNFSPTVSGHLMTELFWPGNYYAPPKGSLAVYLRMQMIFKF